MVIQMAGWERTRSAGVVDVPDGLPFGRRLRRLRHAAGLTQNGLAEAASCDPAYVNRLERQTPASPPCRPTRPVVTRLWRAVSDDPAELDVLLAEAGLLPESVVEAGGWAAYVGLWEGAVTVLERKLELKQAAISALAREVVALRRAWVPSW